MGRYESRRDIAGRTISEHRPRRKRSSGGWAAWFLGRAAALVAILVALIAVGSISLRAADPTLTPAPVQPAKFGKAPFFAKANPDAPAPPHARRHGVLPAPSPAPAAAPGSELGYQILGPEELAAISQARD